MITEKQIKFSRGMYIAEAGLEYLISIIVAGSFFATLAKEIGLSDSLTGILSSIISLGCLFQLLSVAYRRNKVKGLVIFLSIINQLLFMLLYVIPVFEIPENVKAFLFIVLIIGAYVIYNFAHPKKINWLMSLVDDNKRGSFTAKKEIISLIGGMVFSFLMGALIDYFKAEGQIKTAFILSAAVILILTILHTFSMVFAVEKEIPCPDGKNFRGSLFTVFKNKNLLKVTLIFVLYYISNYASQPFFGVYQVNELGFSLKLVSVLTMVASVTRIAFSNFWGRYADKTSFAFMMRKCLVILAISNTFIVFAVPSNGVLMFTLYYIAHGIAMGGINSALINLVFDYSSYETRADALAITQAVAGVTGFLTTLVVSPLVSFIQSRGNVLLGINVYAQQILSIISVVMALIAFIFVKTFRNEEKI